MVVEKQEVKQGDKTVQVSISNEARDSISLKKDTKGNYSYEIKLYDLKGEDIPARIEMIAREMEERIENMKEVKENE